MQAENPENFAAQARKFSPRSSGNRTGFSADFVGALRAQILQCVSAGGWLSERCMRRCNFLAWHAGTWTKHFMKVVFIFRLT
jgi:hypothetical protein